MYPMPKPQTVPPAMRICSTIMFILHPFLRGDFPGYFPCLMIKARALGFQVPTIFRIRIYTHTVACPWYRAFVAFSPPSCGRLPTGKACVDYSYPDSTLILNHPHVQQLMDCLKPRPIIFPSPCLFDTQPMRPKILLHWDIDFHRCPLPADSNASRRAWFSFRNLWFSRTMASIFLRTAYP